MHNIQQRKPGFLQFALMTVGSISFALWFMPVYFMHEQTMQIYRETGEEFFKALADGEMASALITVGILCFGILQIMWWCGTRID